MSVGTRLVDRLCSYFVFFNDTATTEIYTLSLHDALPISSQRTVTNCPGCAAGSRRRRRVGTSSNEHTLRLSGITLDRKSTRLNSSHANISYAVFCLKKKNAIQ